MYEDSVYTKHITTFKEVETINSLDNQTFYNLKTNKMFGFIDVS